RTSRRIFNLHVRKRATPIISFCVCKILTAWRSIHAQERLARCLHSGHKVNRFSLKSDRNHIAPFARAKCNHRGQKRSSAGKLFDNDSVSCRIRFLSPVDSANAAFAKFRSFSPSVDLGSASLKTSEVNHSSTVPRFV